MEILYESIEALLRKKKKKVTQSKSLHHSLTFMSRETNSLSVTVSFKKRSLCFGLEAACQNFWITPLPTGGSDDSRDSNGISNFSPKGHWLQFGLNWQWLKVSTDRQLFSCSTKWTGGLSVISKRQVSVSGTCDHLTLQGG